MGMLTNVQTMPQPIPKIGVGVRGRHSSTGNSVRETLRFMFILAHRSYFTPGKYFLQCSADPPPNMSYSPNISKPSIFMVIRPALN